VDNVIHIHQFDVEVALLHNLGRSHDDYMVSIPEMLLLYDNESNFVDLECDYLCERDKLPFQSSNEPLS
jgi:hypothetical protein